MRLKIIDVNFTTRYDWVFKLADETNNIFFIMNESYYKKRNKNSPISKKELDYYDRGQWINVFTENIDGLGIVVKV